MKQLLGLLRRFQQLPPQDQYNQVQLMTMSAVDFLDQWFETDVLKATMSASGIIGTFLGVRSPGTAYVLLHHYMGEIDGAFRSWGLARGGTGAISNAIADAARVAGVEIRTTAPVSSILVRGNRAEGVVLENGDEIRGLRRRIERRSATHLPAVSRARSVARRLRRGHPPVQVPRFVGEGESRARRAARFHVAARARASSPRSDFDLAERRLHGARLRRREVRPLLPSSVHGHRHSVAHGHEPRTARQARHVVLRPVRAVRS